MTPWHTGPWGWSGMVFMIVMMLLFWGGLLTVILTVLRHPRFTRHRLTEAERILAERLARGEIDEDEYKRRTATLRH
ncbi:SHOCT domain-containing protein [Allokutzneria sp. NRRL B-24872]|uniref:SHOCT domain-containing protein n=1 Tax=Allokutzneria sp. NRRL B-24872 TaxID=1137961 RepID=UPI001FEE9C46|nr:SHOCT domain-containing protein [Allokutzneria sp. NRRL B-24872]